MSAIQYSEVLLYSLRTLKYVKIRNSISITHLIMAGRARLYRLEATCCCIMINSDDSITVTHM